MGRPTVAVNHGGAPEIILDGITGWLFKPNDVDDLAEKINVALNISENERNKMAIESSQRIKMKFDNNFMCNKTINLYQELINRHILNEE